MKTVDLKVHKKSKLRKAYLILAGLPLAFIAIFLLLLLYTPAHYDPPDVPKNNEVSEYLTHELMPEIYNGAQRQKPFNVVIPQSRTKDIVAEAKWPRQSDGISLAAPCVFFIPDNMVLMGTVTIRDVEFVVTVMVAPGVDQNGLLNLHVATVKVGAVNVTFPARLIGRQMYQRHLGAKDVDTADIGAKIAASLLNDQPFEPVFKVEDKKVRIEKVTIEPEKLTLHLIPASDAKDR